MCHMVDPIKFQKLTCNQCFGFCSNCVCWKIYDLSCCMYDIYYNHTYQFDDGHLMFEIANEPYRWPILANALEMLAPWPIVSPFERYTQKSKHGNLDNISMIALQAQRVLSQWTQFQRDSSMENIESAFQ